MAGDGRTYAGGRGKSGGQSDTTGLPVPDDERARRNQKGDRARAGWPDKGQTGGGGQYR